MVLIFRIMIVLILIKKLTMKSTILLPITFIFNILSCTAQAPAYRAHTENPDFDKKVASWLYFTVPTINPENVQRFC